jgi:dienelactone hydrolase
MMLIHGGGWYMVGASAMRTERSQADAWRAAGWETVSVSYPACKGSLLGVLTFYDLVRQQVGNGVPICLEGQSAGAQLALLTAAMRPDVACVIAAGAPTDVRTLAAEGAREAAAGAPAPGLKKGSLLAQSLARAAFGGQATGRRNPIAWAGQIQARVLLATAVNDPMIPAAQATDLANAIQAAHPGAYVDVDRLAPGGSSWVHGTVSPEALNELTNRMTKLVEPFGRKPTSGPPSTGLVGLLKGLLPGFL